MKFLINISKDMVVFDYGSFKIIKFKTEVQKENNHSAQQLINEVVEK
jgi:hypothetical protein